MHGSEGVNQIETQFDLHQITDDDERYRLTFAALSGVRC